MLRQLMQHIRCRRDGVAAQIKLQSSLLGSGDEAVCRSLITRDIHIASGHLCLRLDAIDVHGRRMGVVTIVVTRLDDLDIGFGYGRLLGELLAQEVEGHVEVAAEEPAHESQGEHIAALEDALGVHSRVGKCILHHRGEGAGDDTIRIYAHLGDVVGSFELSLLQILGAEGVGVDDDCCVGLGIAQLCLECCSVHCHQHIAQVARSIDLGSPNMHLESAHTRQRALRGTNVCGIVGEC